MTAVKFEEEIELTIGLPWFVLIYPTHFNNPIIPNVALTELNHYWFSIADTIGYHQLKTNHFAVGQKRGLIGTPLFFSLKLYYKK